MHQNGNLGAPMGVLVGVHMVEQSEDLSSNSAEETDTHELDVGTYHRCKDEGSCAIIY